MIHELSYGQEEKWKDEKEVEIQSLKQQLQTLEENIRKKSKKIKELLKANKLLQVPATTKDYSMKGSFFWNYQESYAEVSGKSVLETLKYQQSVKAIKDQVDYKIIK